MMSSVAKPGEARESLLLLQVQKALLLPHAVHQRQRSSSSRLIKEVAPAVVVGVQPSHVNHHGLPCEHYSSQTIRSFSFT
jgi:hypothetical protein